MCHNVCLCVPAGRSGRGIRFYTDKLEVYTCYIRAAGKSTYSGIALHRKVKNRTLVFCQFPLYTRRKSLQAAKEVELVDILTVQGDIQTQNCPAIQKIGLIFFLKVNQCAVEESALSRLLSFG